MNKSRRGYLFSLAAVVLTALPTVTANAALITVKSGADAGGTCPGVTCTLRQAIATAAPGDTINFGANISTITLTSAELMITKNLTIRGRGANLLSVQRSAAAGTPDFRIFDIVGNTVTISDLTIANGTLNGSGGGNGGGAGIRHDGGTLNVTNCAISGNSVLSHNKGENGGGIYKTSSGTMTVTNCAISANSAIDFGGGIFDGGALTIINTTISGNSAHVGGGISDINGLGDMVVMPITNSTISGNSANEEGGISVAGMVTIRNTIIAKNIAPFAPDVGGGSNALTSQGYNLIGNNLNYPSFAPTTGDQVGTNAAPIDPMLGPLQDNGGPTKTQALLLGSTAIERGDSGGTITDQRGFARPVDSSVIANVGDGSDIGAYEVQADVLPGCSNINRIVKNNNDSGTDSLRDVIAKVCAGSTITFAPDLPGVISLTSGELLINKSLTITGRGNKVSGVLRSFQAPNFRIFNIASNVKVSMSGLSIINGNAPGGFGGGISNNGTLTLTDLFFTINSATGGGAIHNNAGVLTIIRSTLYANTVNTGAAGILNSGTLTIVNSTINENVAKGGNGGGIVNGGTTTITDSTISANSATGVGGGISNFSGTVTMRNSIIALNTASSSAPDFNGPLTSDGFNLIGNSSGATIPLVQGGDQIGTAGSPIDPLLAPAADDGTRPLLPGSPAIDQGESSGLTTDQRGFPRPINLITAPDGIGTDGSDIGAFEVQATTLANISTRLRVETGDNALIAGFIVTGTAPKKVIIRAIGPSIGLADQLADPILELHDSLGATLASNDNWQDSPSKQAIIDSTIPPSDPLESAMVVTLPANNAGYTAIMHGVNNGTGVGVIQAYDLDTLANSKLANVSTRGLVGTGDNVLFAGTIVVGQESQKVIIRALGPSTGVSGSMADPTLELRDGQGTALETNDNWGDSPNKQAILDSGIPPTNSSESAIVRTLPPASYTAIVRGAGGTTGIAVIEVFALN